MIIQNGKWPYLNQKIWYEPRHIAHFEALEQTCRLRQLSGSGGKYFFQLAEYTKATVVLGKYHTFVDLQLYVTIYVELCLGG